MLFLLNDRILAFDPKEYAPPLEPDRFDALTLPFVMKLGQEVFAECPLLHREEPERAKRLATLIATKNPGVNAALFSAPSQGCRPDEVQSRLAALTVDVIAGLYKRDQTGALNAVTADREVWRRMAA
jgi:hypothetical protein